MTTREELLRVLEQQGDDVRALYIRAEHRVMTERRLLLLRAAEMGYAPAQADKAVQAALPGRQDDAAALIRQALRALTP